jgi:hypothetical protein
MNCEISKIVIKLGSREIELTTEEAKSIQAELNHLFNHLELPTMPVPTYVPYPVIVNPEAPWFPRPWEITYTSNSNTLCIST